MKLFAMAAFAGLLSTSSFAYQIDTKHCAGKAYIQDLDGKQVKYNPAIHDFVTEATEVTYKAWRQVAHINGGPHQATTITIENKSNSDVRFYYQPRYYVGSGVLANISPETFRGFFSTSNDPRSSNGASLLAKTQGSISFRPSTDHSGSATIHWESNECIKYPPILAAVHKWWGGSSQAGITMYLINNGNPW